MLKITLHVNAPPGQAIGIKEELAMHCERYGDTKVVKVEEIQPEQLKIKSEGEMENGHRRAH